MIVLSPALTVPAANAKEIAALPPPAQKVFDYQMIKKRNVADLINRAACSGTEVEWNAVRYIESKPDSY